MLVCGHLDRLASRVHPAVARPVPDLQGRVAEERREPVAKRSSGVVPELDDKVGDRRPGRPAHGREQVGRNHDDADLVEDERGNHAVGPGDHRAHEGAGTKHDGDRDGCLERDEPFYARTTSRMRVVDPRYGDHDAAEDAGPRVARRQRRHQDHRVRGDEPGRRPPVRTPPRERERGMQQYAPVEVDRRGEDSAQEPAATGQDEEHASPALRRAGAQQPGADQGHPNDEVGEPLPWVPKPGPCGLGGNAAGEGSEPDDCASSSRTSLAYGRVRSP